MIIYKDKKTPFIELFNPKNGTLVRTNVLNESGQETKFEPVSRFLPELIDFGIMGHCSNEITCKEMGVLCYQGNKNRQNLSFDKYKQVIDQIKGYTFQIALGGKGDPNKHEEFLKILQYTKQNGIIPNLTTSGHNITSEEIDAIVSNCGSVAVSFYSKLDSNFKETNNETINTIARFVKRIPTNIHYVITNSTIDDAIKRLSNNIFPEKINGVIFLLYKPVGKAIHSSDSIIDINKMHNFFDCVFKIRHPFKIGFDTCFSSYLYLYDHSLLLNNSIQKCESGRFSCYISCDFKLYSCSFKQESENGIVLTDNNFLDAWNLLVKQKNGKICSFSFPTIKQ